MSEFSMKIVYLVLDENDRVVAIYDDESVVRSLLEPLQDHLNEKLHIRKININPDIKTIKVAE